MSKNSLDMMQSLSRNTPAKIVFIVLDGLGGLPDPQTGKTELETARTLNLDQMASGGVCGLIDPIGPGITPGSAPGHLGLFGYEPTVFDVGRGVLEAIGIGLELGPGDIAARGNFCSVDKAGVITDRRAGRISTEGCTSLSRLIDGQEIDGCRISVHPVREHRFVAVFRGEGLAPEVDDSDPQQTGFKPLAVVARDAAAERTAAIANEFVARSGDILAGQQPANMIVLRGFSRRPEMPSMAEVYKLRPAVVASYPMYRGLARLVGMEVLETGVNIAAEFQTLERHYQDYDFFFLHVKGTDSAGEDGDFNRKVAVIEEVDAALPLLLGLAPDVIIVTGDHSSPAILKGHSWHPVPILLHSPWCRRDGITEFSESNCIAGGLGRFPAIQIMPLAMAHARKLKKYGA